MTIETRASWAVCLTALGIAAVSFAAPAITVVGLKSIATDLGGERSVRLPACFPALSVAGDHDADLVGIPRQRFLDSGHSPVAQCLQATRRPHG